MSLLKKVYDEYESLDFTYGQDNLNPVREISVRKTDKLSESIGKVYDLIKGRVYAIEKETQPLIEKELNDSVVTGISPFEQTSKVDEGMGLSAAKAGTTGDYVFPNVAPKYTDAGLRVRIQLLMSQLSSIIDTYPDDDIETEDDNPVNDIQDNTFIDTICNMQEDSDAQLVATFSKSANLVSLQWPRIENASYYRIARRKDSDTEFTYLPYLITDTGVLSYSIQDTGLAYSTTYHYKIIPFDANDNLLTESNIETGTTINNPDSNITVVFSNNTYKATVNWSKFIQSNNFIIPVDTEEPYTFTIDDVNYHFVRFEIYRSNLSTQESLFKKENLFATQSDINTFKLSDSTQVSLYPDININYIVCAVFTTDTQFENIESVTSFDNSYKRVWSSLAGCIATLDATSVDASYNDVDAETDNGNDVSDIQSLIDGLSGVDDTGDQLDATSLAECAIQDLGILNMVLSVLSVIAVIINVINLILFVTAQLISIAQLAAACWNNPTNIGKIISMVSERVMAIAINLIGKLIAELLSNLNIDCTSEMTAEVLNKIQSILNASYNLSTSGVMEPLNMANSTWKSAINLRKTLSEQFSAQDNKINEILAEAKKGVLSALNSNPATATLTHVVDDEGNINWNVITSLVKSVPELSSILKTLDSAKGTAESVGQFRNLGTEWKDATTKWTWE